MSYEPYHRKYRPKAFKDVVGQDPVATTLRNALKEDRVANAFLFAGSRGVGKTSMARILAKALNCSNVEDGEPCGTCDTCESIARGEDMDVIEVDGASNRGIDEIRTIRDNVAYAPANARYKVYIIDEVHMLTTQAFNALLKTLEEPPPHVRFVFATTEAHAVLETIVSRCQRFEFRRISLDDIVGRLSWVAEQEGLSVEEDVLREIAVRSEGGLRDSLSLLDQLVSFAGSGAGLDDLDRVLGRIDSQVLEDIIEPASRGDAGGVMDGLTTAFECGRDAEEILSQITELFREAMVRDACNLPGGGDGRRSGLISIIREHFEIDRLLLALRLCLNARREIKLAGQGRLQLELSFLKIARSTDLLPVREILARLDEEAEPSGERVLAPRKSRAQRVSSPSPPASPPPSTLKDEEPPSAPPPSTLKDEEPPSAPPQRTGPPPIDVVRAEWTKVVDVVRQQKPRAASLVRDAVPESMDGTILSLRLPAGADFKQKQLEGSLKDTVEAAIIAVFGMRLQTAYVVPTAEQENKRPRQTKIYEDPGVRRILDSFGGEVVNIDDPDL
ncbi:MAG: DNA polymerase III subunit gamma/tau [Planctomycetes bacterium]|nr:DNA polymerase III subunit gamma/tau [Planctomycetota bacterium]